MTTGFCFLLQRAILDIPTAFLRATSHVNEAVSKKNANHLYEKFASYVRRERINGTVRVLCKARLT